MEKLQKQDDLEHPSIHLSLYLELSLFRNINTYLQGIHSLLGDTSRKMDMEESGIEMMEDMHGQRMPRARHLTLYANSTRIF